PGPRARHRRRHGGPPVYAGHGRAERRCRPAGQRLAGQARRPGRLPARPAHGRPGRPGQAHAGLHPGRRPARAWPRWPPGFLSWKTPRRYQATATCLPLHRGLPPAHRAGRRGRVLGCERELTKTFGRLPMTSPAGAAGTIEIGGDLVVRRMGFGAMRITGNGIWGEPPDEEQAKATLRRVVELGVNFIDTADSYGPEVSE